jgi:hypothetical protein
MDENNNRENDENNPQPINVDKLLDKQSAATRAKFQTEKKSYWNMNMSWVMMILVGLATFGIAFAVQKSATGLSTGYVLLFVIVAYLAALFLYNIGKILFGAIAGYSVGRIEILGLQIAFGKKARVRYILSNILELHMNMVPRDEDEDPKPGLMFWGGTIVYALAASVIMGLTFLPSMQASMIILLRYGLAMGALLVFYEICPCRLDCPNDVYLFIHTKNEEDRTAYNTYLRNEQADLFGEFTSDKVFDSYDNSQIKPLDILGSIHQNVYQGDYEGALKNIELARKYNLILTEKQKCEYMYEELYLFLTHGRSAESEKKTVEVDHQLKKTSDYHPSVSTLRSEILIAGLVDNSNDELKTALEVFSKELKVLGKTDRTEKDVQLVKGGLNRIKQAHPDWDIKPYLAPWEETKAE